MVFLALTSWLAWAGVTATAAGARVTASASARVADACGAYQCFYDASDFLQSVPAPLPGQVATVPLAARAIGPAPGAPSMLVGLDNGPRAYWAVSDGFAQGRSGLVDGITTGNVYNFSHWQYVDELYYYAHVTVSVPPTQWVNAGHRNGIPVLGTVTGDCGACAPQAGKLFTQANYRTTAARLYQYAVAYGFDGWTIDMERSFQPTDGVLAAVRLLVGRRLPDGQPLRVTVYRAGEHALQPAGLLPYFAAGASWQADYAPDAPPPSYPRQTFQNLVSAGLATQRLRAFWSSYVYDDAYKTSCPQGRRSTRTQIWNGNPGQSPECLDSGKLFGNQRTIVPASPPPAYYTSTGLFAAEWTYFGNLPDPKPGQVAVGPASRALVHAADNVMWAGSGVRYVGPSCARAGTSNAVSSLITPRSVLRSLPFVTSFNQGEGDVYAVNGRLVAGTPWNNLSAQDVLPTWACTVRGDLTASPVYATAANGDAYDGGSALLVTGRGAGQVGLYEARIRVPARSSPMLAFTSKTVAGALPSIIVTYANGATQTVRRTRPGPGWQQTTSPLTAQGRTIVRISVGLAGAGGRISTVLGQLRLYDAAANPRPAAIHVTSASPVINWTQPRTPAISYWNVYARSPGCLRFLGPAFTSTYYLPQAMFPRPALATRYVIQPVSATGAAATIEPACRA